MSVRSSVLRGWQQKAIPCITPTVTALEAAQPKDLDASEIDVRLGAAWVGKDTISDFMYETFDTPMYLERYIR